MAAVAAAPATGFKPPSLALATIGLSLAKFMQVLALDKGANGTSVVDGTGPATLAPGERPAGISSGPRVGVTSAHDVPWRFWITGDPTVSTYRRHLPRR